MKITVFMIMILVLLLITTWSGLAQTRLYELTSYAIQGGGLSDGGDYYLIGVVGQPSGEFATGADYSLAGGYLSGWASAPFIEFMPAILHEEVRDTPQ